MYSMSLNVPEQEFAATLAACVRTCRKPVQAVRSGPIETAEEKWQLVKFDLDDSPRL